MKRDLKEVLKSAVQRGARILGLQQLTSLQQQLAPVQQQLTSLQQQLAISPSLWKTFNEVTGASQGVQILLSLRYQEFACRGLPLPELSNTEFRCFSQNGEDGLLLYLFSLIGTTNKRAVEIGVGYGIECNIANLVINHGWEGLMLDGNEEEIRKGKEFYSRCQDTFNRPPVMVSAWITVENVNALITENGFAGDIDLLSIDLDGMDYWILKALTTVVPRAVILEFNAMWGPHLSVSVPYKADFRLDFSKRPYYCGASLAAFVKLCREKGYRLVGVQRQGFNAVFLRSDVGAELFPEISPVECFDRNRTLRMWHPGWIPSGADHTEWRELVEV